MLLSLLTFHFAAIYRVKCVNACVFSVSAVKDADLLMAVVGELEPESTGCRLADILTNRLVRDMFVLQ